MCDTIALIGPMCAGKSSTARLLATRLGMAHVELDRLRWDYYQEIGYDEQMATLLRSSEPGLLERSNYWKPFEAYAVERAVQDFPGCVLDFGAGNGVYEDAALFARVQQALATVAHVILLLPTPDLAEATAVVNTRLAQLLQEVAGTVNPEALRLNAHFVNHPSSRQLATQIIYTGEQTPEQVCETIVQNLGLNASAKPGEPLTQLDRHYTDPRLVDLYDIENPHGPDFDFFLQLADELHAQQILDLGCGTGLLTRQLAVDGRKVTGVDPAAAMLAYARRQPGAEQVTWVEGNSSALGTPNADLVLMTSNVAQVFLDDEQWATTLGHIHAALRPGGHLAFESRNPADRGWEQWNPATTLTQLETPHGPVETWVEVVGVENARVQFRGYNLFKKTGEVLVVTSTLRYRSYAEISNSLSKAGFIIEQVYGNWQREPFNNSSRMMVFIARRSGGST